MNSYREGVSAKMVVEGILQRNSDRQERACGEAAGPNEPKNRYPPNVASAEKVLGVPDHNRYLFDVCPRGCIHWWAPLQDRYKHFTECRNSACKLCKCPHCGESRLSRTKKGVKGAQQCWLFFDALHNMFLDPELANAMLMGRKIRDDECDPDRPSFAKYQEYTERLKPDLESQGFRMDHVRHLDNPAPTSTPDLACL